MNLITGKRLVMVGLSAGVLLGLLDVFIWGPLAQVPGETLAGIYIVIADSGELGWLLPWPLLWAALCVVVMLRVTREWRSRQRGIAQRSRVQWVAGAGRVLLAIGLLSATYYFAVIPMGLWISNHLPPFEGVETPLFVATSAVALISSITGAALLVAASVRSKGRILAQ